MRGKGITYDTGFIDTGRAGAVPSTREPFDPEVVRREMGVDTAFWCTFAAYNCRTGTTPATTCTSPPTAW